jgi:hypothetical protein
MPSFLIKWVQSPLSATVGLAAAAVVANGCRVPKLGYHQ